MLTNYILSALTASLAFAVAPTPASAGKGHRFDVCEAVSCTDTQAKKVRTLLDAKKAATRPIREQSKAVRAELHAEMAKSNPDTALIESLRAELHNLRAQSKAYRAAYMAQVKEVLTAEQVAKLEQVKSKRKKAKGDKKSKKSKKSKGDKKSAKNSKRDMKFTRNMKAKGNNRG
jgi:Spy/CpxP family protein refolding chaperone